MPLYRFGCSCIPVKLSSNPLNLSRQAYIAINSSNLMPVHRTIRRSLSDILKAANVEPLLYDQPTGPKLRKVAVQRELVVCFSVFVKALSITRNHVSSNDSRIAIVVPFPRYGIDQGGVLYFWLDCIYWGSTAYIDWTEFSLTAPSDTFRRLP